MIPTKLLKPADFKKDIISFFENKMTIVEAKKIIAEKILIDEYDNQILVSNVRVFLTTNDNFNGGKSKGYGAGFYITNGIAQIKI